MDERGHRPPQGVNKPPTIPPPKPGGLPIAAEQAEIRVAALAEERDRLLSENQQLRSQIDGWQQYRWLRQQIDEIQGLLDDVFALNIRRKCGHEVYSGLVRIKVLIKAIREREI